MSAFFLWLENALADLILRFGAAAYVRAFEWFAAIQPGMEAEA